MLDAMRRLALEAKLLVEPTGALTLAAVESGAVVVGRRHRPRALRRQRRAGVRRPRAPGDARDRLEPCARSRPGRAPHHARRRRPADVDRLLGGPARDAVRVRAAESRQPGREPPLLRPGRRPADHRLHERGAGRRSDARARGARQRPPPRLLALAGDLRAGRRAARRARHPPQRGQGPRLHGLDLLRGPARAADRARLVPLRAARTASRTPRCCSRRTRSASSARTITSTRCISPTRSSGSSSARGPRSRTTGDRPTRTADEPEKEDDVASNTLSILKPSVNNLTTRIFVRAADLDFAEEDMWGKKGTPDFLAPRPGRPDAAARGGRPAEGRALGELRDHAVPLQQARPRGVLPDRPGPPRDGRQRDVLPHRHALPARRARDLPRALVPAVPGRGRLLRGGRRAQGEGAGGGRCAIAGPLDVYRTFFLDGQPFIGGAQPSIADIRLARRSSSCARSTTRSRTGRRTTWRGRRRRSATRTRSRRRTCATTSPTSSRRPAEPVSRCQSIGLPARSCGW